MLQAVLRLFALGTMSCLGAIGKHPEVMRSKSTVQSIIKAFCKRIAVANAQVEAHCVCQETFEVEITKMEHNHFQRREVVQNKTWSLCPVLATKLNKSPCAQICVPHRPAPTRVDGLGSHQSLILKRCPGESEGHRVSVSFDRQFKFHLPKVHLNQTRIPPRCNVWR